MKVVIRSFLLAICLLTVNTAFSKQSVADEREAYIRANYTKYEYQIPMRDGVKLFTSVYVPNDTSKSYPIMMQRINYYG